jgi:hypothetical protein
MTSNAELYRKMAEVVEAVDDVDGVRVDDANVAERVESSEASNLIAAMMGMGGESETQQVIALVVEPAETPDIDTDGFDDPPDGTEIEIEEEAEPEP